MSAESGKPASSPCCSEVETLTSPGSSMVEVWRTTEVTVTPFPRLPFSDEDFERACNVAYHRWAGGDDEEPGQSMSCGVMGFDFHDDPPQPEKRAEQVAQLMAHLGLEGETTARVVWTVMRTSRDSASPVVEDATATSAPTCFCGLPPLPDEKHTPKACAGPGQRIAEAIKDRYRPSQNAPSPTSSNDGEVSL